MNFDKQQFYKACHNEQVQAPFLKNPVSKIERKNKRKMRIQKGQKKVSHVVRKALDIFNNIVSAFPFYLLNSATFLSQNLLSA